MITNQLLYQLSYVGQGADYIVLRLNPPLPLILNFSVEADNPVQQVVAIGLFGASFNTKKELWRRTENRMESRVNSGSPSFQKTSTEEYRINQRASPFYLFLMNITPISIFTFMGSALRGGLRAPPRPTE